MKFNVSVKMMVSATRKSIALKIISNEISKIPIKVNQLRVEEYRTANLGFTLPHRHMLYHASVDMVVEATTDENARQIVCIDKTLFAETLASNITILAAIPNASYIDALRITAAHKLKLN